MGESAQPVIRVESVRTSFGSKVVHRGVTFDIARGKVVAIIGGSGTGKSVLLREIVGLLRPDSGRIQLFGEDVWQIDAHRLAQLRRRFGVLFQNGALFSALTVGENVATPIHEQTELEGKLIEELVQLRLGLAGLSPDTALKMPSELSGGMRKRVALARALVLEPELLFLDEPTSGLDPINARSFDHLIRTLCDSLNLTIFMVTHDLDSIESITDHVVALAEGKVLTTGSAAEVAKFDHPWIQEYFASRNRSR